MNGNEANLDFHILSLFVCSMFVCLFVCLAYYNTGKFIPTQSPGMQQSKSFLCKPLHYFLWFLITLECNSSQMKFLSMYQSCLIMLRTVLSNDLESKRDILYLLFVKNAIQNPPPLPPPPQKNKEQNNEQKVKRTILAISLNHIFCTLEFRL